MAINQTGAIYKALNFDGQSSRTYGVYITGEAVYNAPERAVEMVTIPGRNGAFAIDEGRFENIEVTYSAGIAADTEAEFAEAISDFRNYLCSRSGYCRLTDEYNPDEFRLAIYKSGLEVEPAMLRAGQFNIVFECQPQRFLTSGETPIEVTSGDTITNPAPFNANPLLEAKGYGSIFLGLDEIKIYDIPLGLVPVFAGTTISETIPAYGNYTHVIQLQNTNSLDNGDAIYLSTVWDYITKDYPGTITSISVNSVTNLGGSADHSGTKAIFNLRIDPHTFTYGTSQTYTASIYADVHYNTVTSTFSIFIDFAYDGDSEIAITFRQYLKDSVHSCTIPLLSADSTKSALGDPTVIDLRIGDAYKIEGGETVPLNNAVQIPAILPALEPGNNTITYDNTITELKIIPNWWKI